MSLGNPSLSHISLMQPGASCHVRGRFQICPADMVQAPRRSFERVRADRPTAENRRRPSVNTGGYWDDYGGYDEFSPTAPDPPDSPITTTATSSSQSSSSRSTTDNHWVPNVFLQGRPTTAFETTGQACVSLLMSKVSTANMDARSACHGPHMPGASTKIAQDYDKLLEL